MGRHKRDRGKRVEEKNKFVSKDIPNNKEGIPYFVSQIQNDSQFQEQLDKIARMRMIQSGLNSIHAFIFCYGHFYIFPYLIRGIEDKQPLYRMLLSIMNLSACDHTD